MVRVTPVPWCILGSLTSGLPWSWWQRKRHSQLKRNPQCYVSGKRPMVLHICGPKHIWGAWKFIELHFAHGQPLMGPVDHGVMSTKTLLIILTLSESVKWLLSYDIRNVRSILLPWAAPDGPNGQLIMTLHIWGPRKITKQIDMGQVSPVVSGLGCLQCVGSIYWPMGHPDVSFRQVTGTFQIHRTRQFKQT